MLFYKILIALCLAGANALANPQVEQVALEYHQAFESGDKKKIRELSTEEHYQSLTKNGLLDRLFKDKKADGDKNKTPKDSKTKLKVEVIESKVVKGVIMAKVQEPLPAKSKTPAHADWYQIKKVGDKYLVEKRVHADE